MIEEWGVHPSWTRAVASPEPYFRLEEKLSDILDGLHVAVFPTITLIHMGLLPELAGRGGVIFADNSAHTSIRETCFLAEGKGARTEVWPHMELAALEELLQENMDAPARIIAVDGIYSMSGHLAPLEELLDLADKYDATLYVDDAHGFGVLGEDPSPDAPFGRKGNGSIKYLGLSLHHDRLIYIAGLSKAYSSMGAFVASSNPDIKRLAETSSTYVFSGPVPVASLAGALAGFDIAVDEAEPVQSKLAALTKRFSDGVQEAGFKIMTGPHDVGFPIVHVQLDGSVSDVIQSCRKLWDNEPAILLTPAVYPSVPLGEGGLRLQITTAHTEKDIDEAITAIKTAYESLSDGDART